MSESTLVFERQILAEQDQQSAIQLLSLGCPEISKQKLKLAMKYGAVWISDGAGKNKPQRLRRAKRPVSKGSSLFIYFNQAVLFNEIAPAQLVSDRGEYSVWNKPSGMFSQGTKWGDHSAIGRWVELFGLQRESLSQRDSYIVHRLDRATNGLIVIAHTKSMVQKLAAMFEARKVIKQYSAVVDGQFPFDKWSKFDSSIDERPALTHILSADYSEGAQQSVLRVQLETGRKHQIRKHLAGVGFPIKNDSLYGNQKDKDKAASRHLMLRACLLTFNCPIDKRKVKFELPGYDLLPASKTHPGPSAG